MPGRFLARRRARGRPSPEPRVPLLSNPTYCGGGGLDTEMVATTWQHPDVGVPAAAEAPAMTDCNQVDFSPTIEAKPTTNLADSPSGLEFHLHLPQNEDPDGIAEAHLREAKVVLPPRADGQRRLGQRPRLLHSRADRLHGTEQRAPVLPLRSALSNVLHGQLRRPEHAADRRRRRARRSHRGARKPSRVGRQRQASPAPPAAGS